MPVDVVISESVDEIRNEMRQWFVQVALDPKAPQRHPTGPDSANRLGYDPTEIDALPASVIES